MGAGVGQGTEGDEDYTPLVPQVRVRIGVECAAVGEFVERYCRFVDGDRIFIVTDVVEAAGSLVQFRVDLADGRAVIHGTGTVIESRAEPVGALPRGMLLRFVALDEASARIVEAMAARRARSTPSFGVPSVDKAQAWHTQSVERELVLPANPFGDVPDAALAFFVDWSIERNGSQSLRRGPSSVAFAAVRMDAPRRRRARLPMWLPFVVGVVAGGVGLVALIHGTRELDRALRPAASPAAPASFTPPPVAAPLVAAPLVAPPPAVAAVERGDKAPLAIAAEPGAVVVIDGARVGRTPLVVDVARGAHVVELSRPRYETTRLDVTAPGRASARLERPRALLRVACNVDDAELFVDGEAAGRTPARVEVAGYERVAIEVRAADGRRWHKRIYVRPPVTDLAATFAAE